MCAVKNAKAERVEVRIELFGLARITAGRRELRICLPSASRVSDVAQALADVCPPLLGIVLLEDGSGLLDNYTLNLNGTSFVADGAVRLAQGDSLLIFSSQAGG